MAKNVEMKSRLMRMNERKLLYVLLSHDTFIYDMEGNEVRERGTRNRTTDVNWMRNQIRKEKGFLLKRKPKRRRQMEQHFLNAIRFHSQNLNPGQQ